MFLNDPAPSVRMLVVVVVVVAVIMAYWFEKCFKVAYEVEGESKLFVVCMKFCGAFVLILLDISPPVVDYVHSSGNGRPVAF